MNADRTLPWDWYPGRVPENVRLEADAYVETTFSFHLLRSGRPDAVRLGRATSLYLGVMFDLGPQAAVSIGDFSLIHGTRFIVNTSVRLGRFCLLSWNTVLMDTRRAPGNPAKRRAVLTAAAGDPARRLAGDEFEPGRPIILGDGVWIGFDSCVLPGVRLGDGAIVGARSVVADDVPDYCIVAGNPARPIRQLDPEESRQAMALAMDRELGQITRGTGNP